MKLLLVLIKVLFMVLCITEDFQVFIILYHFFVSKCCNKTSPMKISLLNFHLCVKMGSFLKGNLIVVS